MNVLLIEYPTALLSLSRRLRSQGEILVETTFSLEPALALLRRYAFDLVVLNPGELDACALVRDIRSAGLETPLLVMADDLGLQSRVAVFAAGADDVIEQETDVAELHARMRAIVRRSRGPQKALLRAGDLVLNPQAREVKVAGTDATVPLTGKELELLELLILRNGAVVGKQAMFARLYNGVNEPDPKILEVFVCKIRRKLAQAGASTTIGTVWGRGYMLREESRRAERRPAPAPAPKEQAVDLFSV